MSHYTRYDFSETLGRASLSPAPKSVIAAWGISPEGWGSWSGGFLLELENNTVVYLEGWCDTTGWGCQDGVRDFAFDSVSSFENWVNSRSKEDRPYDYVEYILWDRWPPDLNLWISNGMKSDDKW